MIDSHCHLADQQFAKDLPAVLERAAQAGVMQMVCIADSLPEAARCIELAQQYPQLFATVGVHPHHAKDWSKGSRELFLKLVRWSDRVKAIGEIGLDYHYFNSPRDVQLSVFREQLTLAKECKLPVVVHCREAIADVRQIVDELQPPKLVLHCCTEKWEDIQPLVERGYFLSFTGIATYVNTEDTQRTIRECPPTQLMIETDSPYLAPIPYRGKRNEPAYVREVARAVARIKGLTLEEVDRMTTKNAVDFFGLTAIALA